MNRIGLGQDSHSFIAEGENKPFVLGGVKVAENGGLEGNSDGDVILHSICNALSSSIGGDSLSTWSDEMCLRQGIRDSARYVEYIFNKVESLKYSVVNISISVEAKKPYLKMNVIKQIKNRIASLLKVDVGLVGLTFTSGEGLTSFGQGLGIQALTIVNISKND
jgi:2-C-methyl-D-erythritol 2,4-cyclodiphosphate synthase